jgi:hypothetical protein
MSERDHSDKGEMLFRSGLLERAVAMLEPAYRADPGNLKVGRRLVDAYRACGRLDAAAALAARLVTASPADTWLRRIDDIFSGRPAAPTAPTAGADALPAAFVVHDDFLPEPLRREMFDRVLGASERLEAATVSRRFAGRDVDQRVDAEVRRARTLPSPRDIAAIMEPRLHPVVQADAHRLGLPSPQIDHIELEVAVYGDGDHFHCHQDLFEAPASRRVISYVFFFAPEPRGFAGGELLLYDSNPTGGGFVASKFTRIEPLCNRLVLFDPATYHEVTPILCASSAPRDLRYTATGWVHEAV